MLLPLQIIAYWLKGNNYQKFQIFGLSVVDVITKYKLHILGKPYVWLNYCRPVFDILKVENVANIAWKFNSWYFQ